MFEPDPHVPLQVPKSLQLDQAPSESLIFNRLRLEIKKSNIDLVFFRLIPVGVHTSVSVKSSQLQVLVRLRRPSLHFEEQSDQSDHSEQPFKDRI
jgi:hypothetical protein